MNFKGLRLLYLLAQAPLWLVRSLRRAFQCCHTAPCWLEICFCQLWYRLFSLLPRFRQGSTITSCSQTNRHRRQCCYKLHLNLVVVWKCLTQEAWRLFSDLELGLAVRSVLVPSEGRAHQVVKAGVPKVGHDVVASPKRVQLVLLHGGQNLESRFSQCYLPIETHPTLHRMSMTSKHSWKTLGSRLMAAVGLYLFIKKISPG